MTGWWQRATREQRLAQIDGAIEIGIPARIVARNCGAPSANAVRIYAHRHGRNFANAPSYQSREGLRAHQARRGQISQAKRAFLRGDPVDFWGAE